MTIISELLCGGWQLRQRLAMLDKGCSDCGADESGVSEVDCSKG